MAKAKKLPSGSWRCLVYDYTDVNGKRIYKSFTSTDSSPKGKREVELMAAEYAAGKESRRIAKKTFEEALEEYINSRESVLSAGTIREYRRSQKADFKAINQVSVYDITQDDIQRVINDKAKTCKPKTVRNLHGLISAVLKYARPDFALNTTLPQKQRPKLYIPTDSDVQKLIESVGNDNDMLLAILLAAFGPLRRSEICGLETSDIKDGTAHIQRAVVLDEHNRWVTKSPKSTAGDRYIPLPDFVIAKMSGQSGKVVELMPSNITDRFEWILKRSGLPHFRFHDLRHYCASIQHAMGIPDAYIMQRGGWGSDAVLKTVYRHALEDKEIEMNKKANDYFSNICNTKCNTKK